MKRFGLSHFILVAVFLFLLMPVFASATTFTATYGGVTYFYDPSTGAYSSSSGPSVSYLTPGVVAELISTTAGINVTISNSYLDRTSVSVSFTTGGGVAQNQNALSIVFNAVHYSSSANELVQPVAGLNPVVNSASENSDGTVNISASANVGGIQLNIAATNIAPPKPPKLVVAPVYVPYWITFSNPPDPVGGVADVFIEPEYESFEKGSGPTGGSKYCPSGFTPQVVGGISDGDQFNTMAACVIYRTSSSQEGVTAVRVVAGGTAATCSGLGMALRVTPPGSRRPAGGIPEDFGVSVATCISKGTSNVLTDIRQTGGDVSGAEKCPSGFTPAPSGVTSIKDNGSQTCVVNPVVPPASCPAISGTVPVSCDIDGNGTTIPLPPRECIDPRYGITPPATPGGSTITLNSSLGGVINRRGGECNPSVFSNVKFKVTEDSESGPYVPAAQLYVNESPVAGRLTVNDLGGYNLEMRNVENVTGTYQVKFTKSGYQNGDSRPITVREGDNGPFPFVLKKLCQDLKAINSGQIGPCRYNPPVVDLKVNGADGSITVPKNSLANLNWITFNTPVSCVASGAWSGSKNAGGGSEQTSALSGPNAYTYNITCANTNGSGSDSVTINISPPISNIIPPPGGSSPPGGSPPPGEGGGEGGGGGGAPPPGGGAPPPAGEAPPPGGSPPPPAGGPLPPPSGGSPGGSGAPVGPGDPFWEEILPQ